MGLFAPVSGHIQQSAISMRQIICAGDDGVIYLIDRFTVRPFARAPGPITHVVLLPAAQLQSKYDAIVCIGEFSSVIVFHEGKVCFSVVSVFCSFIHVQIVCEYSTSEWPHCIAVGDVNGDGIAEIVFGTMDNTLHVITCTL